LTTRIPSSGTDKSKREFLPQLVCCVSGEKHALIQWREGFAILVAFIGLSSCGGGSAPSYFVGGNLSGLSTGQSVTLQTSGAGTVNLRSDGRFSFPSPLASGQPYEVTVSTQPDGQRCS
jgi:hypothetical protein